MTNEEKEIRQVLLGRTVLLEDGRIGVLPSGEFHFSAGISDGAGAVRFLGLGRRSETFETALSEQKVTKTALRCMQEIGRGLYLKEQPDTLACIIRYLLTKPTVLTFRYIDGAPVLTAWCGRSIAGLISMRRALKDFNEELKEMTDEIVVSADKAPELDGKEKKEKDKASRKEAKAAIKEAKKAEKEAKKVQKAQEKAAAALAAAEAAKAEAEARAAAAAAEAARLAAEAQQLAGNVSEAEEPTAPESLPDADEAQVTADLAE